MKSSTKLLTLCAALLTLCAALALAGCNTASESGRESAPNQQSAPSAAQMPAGAADPAQPSMQTVSLSQADAAQPAPAERKIIRNAELTVVADRPAEAMRRVASVAEARGGFVVTSEVRQQGGGEGGATYEVVTVELRVPAAQFDAAVGEVRAVGSSVAAEKITGRDVTEEYIDLEARIRTQRALETQFLEIMKGARAVADALEVQRELANVRTEIERLEGRRRFLENQTSLSTIKVTLRPSAPLVDASGFGHGLRDAVGDGADAALTITLGLVRVSLALIPLALFVGLPLYLLGRYAVRRARRRAPPAAPELQ